MVPAPRNVVVIGPSGSGKSTAATQIANALGLRFVELDALFWEPNWTPAERDVFRARITDAIVTDGWAVAGNYTETRDLMWPRADLIVWLDLRLSVVLRRLVVRSWQRSRTQELLWGTNRERFWRHLVPREDKSLLWFTAKGYHRRRRELETAMAAAPPATRWVRLRTQHEVDRWLRSLTAPVPD